MEKNRMNEINTETDSKIYPDQVKERDRKIATKRDTQKQTEKRETEHASSQRTVTHLLL